MKKLFLVIWNKLNSSDPIQLSTTDDVNFIGMSKKYKRYVGCARNKSQFVWWINVPFRLHVVFKQGYYLEGLKESFSIQRW